MNYTGAGIRLNDVVDGGRLGRSLAFPCPEKRGNPFGHACPGDKDIRTPGKTSFRKALKYDRQT